MKKRILSLVLAIVMCFSVVSVFAADEAELFGRMDNMVELYRDRIWDWQANQFGSMTEEQTAVIDSVWASYEANKDAIKAQAVALADGFVTEKVLTNETMKDLYKWKLMRDIMEENLDVTSEDASYTAWLDSFTAFEEANDEAISVSAPMAALNGLGDYADDLTVFFGELALIEESGVLAGENADKVALYVDAYLAEEAGEAYPDGFAEALKEDVVELAADGMFNAFDLGMQLATNQLNEGNSTGLFDMIADRDVKAAFLILGEDFVRYAIDLVPTLRSEFMALNKEELIAAVAGANGTGVMSGDNERTITSMYETMKAVAEYIASQPFCADAIQAVSDAYDVDAVAAIGTVVEALFTAMDTIDENHGLELVQMNVYMGRELLRYKDGEEWTRLGGAAINGDEVTELTLGFAHDRYPSIAKLNELGTSLAQFDANYDADGFVVNSGTDDSPIGMLYIDVTDEADGEAVVAVYRGYSFDEYAEDVYRYVTSFTVTAESEAVDYEVVLEDIADVTADGIITVKGTTNLDYVTVVIRDGEETIYAVVYSKEELEEGISIPAPDGAEVGDVYEVIVGTELASDTKSFTILADTTDYEVVLEDIADVEADGTITVKGTTNLDYVTVVIRDGEETIYAVVYSKEELEAGITLNVPDGAAAGDVYDVIVGTELASDTKSFTILADTTDYEVVLEDIADVEADGTITIKGTTNLDHVTVSIVKGEEKVYVLVYTKAEFEAGITLNVPDGAAAGDVYTVTVGTELAYDTDDFTILAEPVLEPTLSLAGDTDGDGVADRTVKKGSKIDITTTPQNIPEGSTAEVVWTITNAEGEVELVQVGGDYNNILQIKGITVGSGVVITGTLYVDGVATSATVTVNVTVKKKSGGISVSDKEEPTEPTDDVVKPHVCQWPDIAATGTKAAHWAHETIDQMTINGYIKGYEDGTFKPDQNITRAEFSAIVYRILGLEKAEDGVLYDDTVGHWAEDIIATMSLPEGYGMLRGYGDGNFGPNDLITREQAVAIIARAKSAVWTEAKEGAKDVFTDAEDISWWFDGEMDAAVANGLITGYEDGSYKPLKNTTRAEACVLLARAWPEIVE